ncbi:maltose alpha-D-glucosyltransferase [Kushneria aurantia]|uniref:Maltokinase n=1 Tax=Kushneria aurantia TaxID=504092 RepID=A0ABV6FZA7_9GAMM|nr:maltose alpha-D-glucosyltransferase [Kushneria aurantia]
MNVRETTGTTWQSADDARPAFIDDPHWYRDAVIYQVHVKSFFDANNDGIGDFEGLIASLDYIAGLGVNTIWLLPFYPSPRRDDGYDISEYCAVSPDYGTLEQAQQFIEAAHARGLRVITELVINHTSDQHPWFQRARRAPKGSPERAFYVWSDSDEYYSGTRIIFLDTESSNWTWDPVAGQYFWHRFYSHQPDLNFDNPVVFDEVMKVMHYWLSMGVDGLRLDAIPYLVERDGTNNENLPETHEVLKRIRAVIDEHYPDRMLLAEANQWPEDTRPYFGDGDECHMAFHFPLMPRMYMAVAQEDRFPITDILRQTPDIPEGCQWAIFLRNHDELTLEMVTDRERDYLWNHYAADRRARINLGIRRRLAPLLERDRRRIELLNSLLLSMPGTPTIYYGDEIGMGDNIHLGDRDGVRTPMQWSMDRNGGFSRADPASMVLPPVMDPLYGFQTVNVEAQSRDSHSLLNWMRRMLAVRGRQQAFGRGALRFLYPANRRILAYVRELTRDDGSQESILCVANVSRTAQAVELDLSAWEGRVPVEMIGGSSFPPVGQLNYLLTLPPYGFYWFMLAPEASMPVWHEAPRHIMPDLLTLVIKRHLDEVGRGSPRRTLERDILPQYLPRQRWFAAKGSLIDRVSLLWAVRFDRRGTADSAADVPMLLGEVAVHYADATPCECYALPLGLVDEVDSPLLSQQLAMARVRLGREVDLLTDAFALPEFARAIVAALREGVSRSLADNLVETSGETSAPGTLEFTPTSQLAALALADDAEVRHLHAEQSNSSLIIGDQVMIKLLRRVEGGIHPEAEVGRYLTERGFTHMAPLLGEVTRRDNDGVAHVLMVVQGYIDNQGDAWSWTLNNLERAIHDASEANHTGVEEQLTALADLSRFAAALGLRLGQMHALLAQHDDDPDFAPEVADAARCADWAQRVKEQVQRALAIAEHHLTGFGEEEQQLIHWLLSRRERLMAAVDELAAQSVGSLCTRTHGDLHLGQVLVSHDDAWIIDFEGEPARPLAERREKTTPLRDVAGVVRSFDYASAMALDRAWQADVAQDREKISRGVIEGYRQRVTQAFLLAYREAAQQIGHQWQFDNGASAALSLFTLEKAVYEIAYEAANRPAWLGVPLRGLAAMLEALINQAPDPFAAPGA